MPIDIKTIVVTNIITDIVMFVFITKLWSQTRGRFSGLGFIVIDYLFQTVCMILLILRGIIPDFISMVVSNWFGVSGIFIAYIGFGYFLGRRTIKIPNYIVLAVFPLIASYFVFVHNDLAMRTLNLSAIILIICVQCAWITLIGTGSTERRKNLFLGLVFTGLSIISIVRIVAVLIGLSPGNDFYHSGAFSAYVIISYEVFFILQTIALVLMANSRLIAGITLQEEKFSKAFRSSPCIITLTRLSDGLIIDANDGFHETTGYSPDEIRGKTTDDIHFWHNPDDRSDMIGILSREGSVYGREITFNAKSESCFIGLYSAEVITINNEKVILTSINDITERKRAEESLRKSYEENRLLLRELQHRAKNSFAMISGMINLAESNQEECKALHDISIRIRAVSELYNLLYATDSITVVRLDDYLTRVVSSIFRASGAITLSESYEKIMIPVKITISLGIIVTEIITNAVKYAFPGDTKGTIMCALRKTNTGAVIEISDDGTGLPDDFDIEAAHSLGIKLIIMLIKQIHGDYSLDGKNGTCWRISFPVG